MTAMTERIEAILRAAFEGSFMPKIEVTLDQGCDNKFTVFIISNELFDGVPLLRRHRSVQAPLKALIDSNEIHALTLKLYTMFEAKDKGLY